uniref:Uncharacterized protein n=1 Tax=Talaromyces marneffei PM1 TaxID=1077442 RepID=A0A093V2G3_TALMA
MSNDAPIRLRSLALSYPSRILTPLSIPIVYISDSGSEEIVVTVAYYSLAWILILNHVDNIHANDNDNDKPTIDFSAIIQARCSSILTADALMDSCEDGCIYIRMILPLRLVADLMASDKMHKESALCRLELWRRDEGLKSNLTLSKSIRVH